MLPTMLLFMNKLSNNAEGDGVTPLDSNASIWERLGSFAFRRRRTVLAAWVVVLVGTLVAVGSIGSSSESSFESPDSDSLAGFEILKENFGAGGSFISGSIVFEAEQGVAASVVQVEMSALFDEVGAIEEVTLTSPVF